MAGLWERVKPGGLDGEGGDRVNIHLVVAGIKGHTAGHFTKPEVLAAVNSQLTARGGTALAGAEVTDLDAIADVADGKANNTLKLVYIVGAVEPMMVAGEFGEVNETKWRTVLEI